MKEIVKFEYCWTEVKFIKLNFEVLNICTISFEIKTNISLRMAVEISLGQIHHSKKLRVNFWNITHLYDFFLIKINISLFILFSN